MIQTCFESVHSEIVEDTNDDIRKHIRDQAGDVSDRFVEDVLIIFDKLADNEYIVEMMQSVVSSSSSYFIVTMKNLSFPNSYFDISV